MSNKEFMKKLKKLKLLSKFVRCLAIELLKIEDMNGMTLLSRNTEWDDIVVKKWWMSFCFTRHTTTNWICLVSPPLQQTWHHLSSIFTLCHIAAVQCSHCSLSGGKHKATRSAVYLSPQLWRAHQVYRTKAFVTNAANHHYLPSTNYISINPPDATLEINYCPL